MLKRGDKNRGFTLTEVIVVLVILAILAAFTIPAMMGYIQKAKEQRLMENAKRWYTASQAVFAEMYANGEKKVAGNTPRKKEISQKAEADNCNKFIVFTNGDLTKSTTASSYTIIGAYYQEKKGSSINAMLYYDNTWHYSDKQFEQSGIIQIMESKYNIPSNQYYTIK